MNKLAIFFFSGLAACNFACAQTSPVENWQGVSLKLTHKSDLLSNVSGGLARGSVWLANSEARVNLDLQQLAGWDGASAYLHYHVQHGAKSINTYVGSFAGVDNLESHSNAGQFFQAWLQKNSADDSLSLLAGLYAIDSEFYVTETSSLFLQPPYGMSSELAQTGKNGPPIFPMGALGLRAKYSRSGFYLQGALTDGVPGNPAYPQGTQIRLGEGTLAIVEFGDYASVEGKSHDKTAVGGWRYSAPAQDLSMLDASGNPLPRPDRGFYFLAERSAANPALSGFIRIGSANKDAYQADWAASLGLQYQRNERDTVGIALSACHASSKYQGLKAAKSYETTIEISYRAQLQPWLALQPMLQHVYHPNMDAALPNAWL